MNELLLQQIKKHFGAIDNLPDDLKGIIQDINNTYKHFEDDRAIVIKIGRRTQSCRGGIEKRTISNDCLDGQHS